MCGTPTGTGYADVQASFAAFTGAQVDPSQEEASYAPFIQLAVARYQRESLPGLSVSTVVRTEMVQLMPDRRLAVDRADGQLKVTLHGPGPMGDRPNRVDAFIERHPLAPEAAAAIDLARIGGDDDGVPAWTRMAGHAVSGDLNSQLPPLPCRPPTAERFGSWSVKSSGFNPPCSHRSTTRPSTSATSSSTQSCSNGLRRRLGQAVQEPTRGRGQLGSHGVHHR